MIYSEIVSAALSSADREDSDCALQIDNFLRYVEARINRFLENQEMALTATLPLVNNIEEYALPSGFLSAKSIKVRSFDDDTGGGKNVAIVNLEQFVNLIENGATEYYCNFVKNRIKLNAANTGDVLEIEYYGRLDPLTVDAPLNWLSDIHPDAYVYGLLVEINSWVKDPEAASLWDKRFNEVLDSIKQQNNRKTISGNPLQIRLG